MSLHFLPLFSMHLGFFPVPSSFSCNSFDIHLPDIIDPFPFTFPLISPHVPDRRGQHPLHRLHHPKQCPPWMLNCCTVAILFPFIPSMHFPGTFHQLFSIHPLSLHFPHFVHQRPFISINFASFLSILFPAHSIQPFPMNCLFAFLSLFVPAVRFFTFCPCIFLHLGFCVQFLCLSFRSLPVTPVSLHFLFSPLFRIVSTHSIIRIIRDDAGNAGALKTLVFGLVFGRCADMLQNSSEFLANRLSQSANPSPLIRVGPVQNVCAWSEHGRRMVGAWSAHVLRMVGGMGRTALYLKVSPTGLWPAARSRPVAGFKAADPSTGGQPSFFFCATVGWPERNFSGGYVAARASAWYIPGSHSSGDAAQTWAENQAAARRVRAEACVGGTDGRRSGSYRIGALRAHTGCVAKGSPGSVSSRSPHCGHTCILAWQSDGSARQLAQWPRELWKSDV